MAVFIWLWSISCTGKFRQKLFLFFLYFHRFCVLAFFTKKNFFSLSSFVFVGILYPMLGPLIGKLLLGQPVYSGWNMSLQRDIGLTHKVLTLCALSTISMTVVSFVSWSSPHTRYKKIEFTPLSNYIIIICLLITGFFLERSGSVINSTYTQNLANESRGGGLDAMLAQFFIIIVSLAAISSNTYQRKKIFSVVLVALSIYFLLQARRSENHWYFVFSVYIFRTETKHAKLVDVFHGCLFVNDYRVRARCRSYIF